MASGAAPADPNGKASQWTPGKQGRPSREQVAQMQRARIMRAAAQVVAEHGFSGASITRVAEAAGVSRATFYHLFESFEQCFLAVLDAAMRRTSAQIAQASAQHTSWQQQAVAGLAVLLARSTPTPASRASAWWRRSPRDRRPSNTTHARSSCSSTWWTAPPERHAPTDTARRSAPRQQSSRSRESLHRRLITGEAPPFIDLLAPLTSLALEPYFHAQEVAEAHEHAQQLARDLTKKHVARHTHPATSTAIPKALTNPRAHRARECLRYLAAHPRASNRAIADGIGLTRREHATGLLARLADKGLLVKQAGKPGHPNAWWLTPHGEQVAQALEDRA